MTVLGVVAPIGCDPVTGVPLDWERCRTCEGSGWKLWCEHIACEPCGGHGSLKAAALAALSPDGPLARNENHPLVNHGDARRIRCEGCGHPMGEETWLGEDRFARSDGRLAEITVVELAAGREPDYERNAWTSCDEGCRHGDGRGVRLFIGDGTDDVTEASWRAVDVRVGMLAKRAGLDPLTGPLLARPFDLRPENLALLCLRCWAAPGEPA